MNEQDETVTIGGNSYTVTAADKLRARQQLLDGVAMKHAISGMTGWDVRDYADDIRRALDAGDVGSARKLLDGLLAGVPRARY